MGNNSSQPSSGPYEVCVVGSVNSDLVSYVERIPNKGETVHGTSFATFCGGKGANQAVMAGLLGAKTLMMGKVGADTFGTTQFQNFKDFNVSTECLLQTKDASTGCASISVDAHGANTIVIVGGANHLLTVDEVQTFKEQITASKVVVTQLEIKDEATIAALQIARQAGVTTVLNPAPAKVLDEKYYSCVDFLIPNEHELGICIGETVETVEEAEKACQVVLKKGVKTVICTLGEKGALIATADGITHITTTKVKAIDTVGAGDSFIGSFSTFIARGDAVADAVRKACKIASVSVQRKGAQESYPTLAEMQEQGCLTTE